MAYKDTDPDREPRLSDPVARGDEQSGMTMIGIVAAIAVALVIGLVYFNMGESTNTTATNTSPGVTTGSSTASPPPPANSGDTTAPAKR